MKALVFVDGRPRLVDRPRPVPGEDEALIEVRYAGVCGTDLEIARGYMDFDGIPGHEFVGVVRESAEASWVGCRIVGEINAACGACDTCHRDLRRHCPNRTVLGILGRDGAFAQWLALPVENLHRVPDEIPDRSAVFVEPLAAAHEMLAQGVLAEEGRPLVLGDGRLGQLCAAVLATTGARPVVYGRHARKLARAAAMGWETIPAPAQLERKYDPVVEATGSPDGLALALAAVRPRGTIVLKSTYHGMAQVPLTAAVIDEVSIVGSRCGPFEPALDHLRDDPSLVEGLVDAVYPIERVDEAFAHATQRDALKILLSF